MAVAVVQGASRGIGLQYCRHILAHNHEAIVYATCRDPSNATELQNLHDTYSQRLRICKVDATREEDIASAAREVGDNSGGLDLLVNCAAMLHPSGRGETSLKQVLPQDVASTLLLNTIGPLVMAKHFAPLLQRGQGRFGSSEAASKHSGVLVNMSAKVGSITDNSLGGWYSYRMSKAALNMATKTISIELGRGKSKVICVSLHPGTVNTDLSRPYHKNVPKEKLFSTGYSVNSLMKIIDGLSVDQTGKFFAWDGSELPF